jgi:RND family efflux transporter MFP subunit
MKLCHALFAAFTLLAITPFGPHAQEGKQDKIRVALPVQRQVVEFVECTGRTSPVTSVAIIPRVTGYVIETVFKEGDLVKKDDVLFKIDPRPYEAQVKAAQAQLLAAKSQLAVAEAKLSYDATTNKRYMELARRDPAAVSQRELAQFQALEDQSKANVDLAGANILLAQANLVKPTLDLEWTSVRSPIDGRAGRYFVTRGNLVTQDVTQLTTVVSTDTMCVYFDLDERTYLQLKRSNQDDKTAEVGKLKVHMGLIDQVGYPHEGIIDFVDNRVDAKTGSVPMRAVFANPKIAKGSQLLMAGMTARVQLEVGPPRSALLVHANDSSTIWHGRDGTSQVFVLNGNKVESRTVKLGKIQSDNLIVIEEGLTQDDRIVLNGRPLENMTIRPEQIEQVAMPSGTKK